MRLLPAEGSRIPAWRLGVTYAAMAGVLLTFLGRLFSLQILGGTTYLEAARENRITNVRLPAPRGVIYDRNGSLLVRNLPAYNVMVTPGYLPDSEAEVEAIYTRLSELTGVPVVTGIKTPGARCRDERGIRELVTERASIAPYEAWPVACDVPETVARILREQQVDMPGVSVEADPVRDYTTDALTSAILGYLGRIPAVLSEELEAQGFVVDRDRIGYSGIEVAYQSVLSGRNGFKQVEEDVAGQPLREVGEVRQPTPGNSLELTIDTRLQAAADTALRNRMEAINRFAGEVRTPLGVVIAMNPQTGEILALSTLPTYSNNNILSSAAYYESLTADERGKPLVNHAISSTFPPGSTFKLVTAVGALTEGVVTPSTTLFDPGVIPILNAYYPNDPGQTKEFFCHKRDGHGNVQFLKGLAVSCNVYFYKVGGGYPGEPIRDGGLGIDSLFRYASALGYGAPLGIELPAEEGGLVPSRDWKRITLGESWSTGDTYNTATGQGFVLATPLQVLTSVATIANGGRVMWPHLVERVLDGEGNLVREVEPCVLWDLTDGVLTPLEEIGTCRDLPESVTRFLDVREFSPDLDVPPEVLELVRAGMRQVVAANESANGYEGTVYQYARIGAEEIGDPELIPSAGKTGTGEFCDKLSDERGLCIPGAWPSHAWYAAFAPYENPEIAVVAFVYNGSEGAVTAGPIVKQVFEAYFNLKAIDAARQG
ncbi:MAG: penicillin-binding protein 2 [Chloroflexi bacterium]|nr:penicillin-binding protein 2 [Chloroflexota bacterium]